MSVGTGKSPDATWRQTEVHDVDAHEVGRRKQGHARSSYSSLQARAPEFTVCDTLTQRCNWVTWCWFARKWDASADQSATV